MTSLFGCGGGGGGGGGSGGGDSTKPTVAVLAISTQGAIPDGTTLFGIEMTVTYPSSVSVSTDETVAVVTPSGKTAGKADIMIDPQVPGSSRLTFLLTSTAPEGFTPGEIATVRFNIVPGSSPQTADFTVSGLNPVTNVGAPAAIDENAVNQALSLTLM